MALSYYDFHYAGLHCDNNKLASLDVRNNTALTIIYCVKNQLKDLDVSRNTALTYLDFGFNELSSLDISKNTALIHLGCYRNQLTSLNVSKNTALERIDCQSNKMSSEALNELFRSLHSNDLHKEKIIYIANNYGTRDCDISIAEDKNWTVNTTSL